WFDAELSQQPDTADAEYFFLNDACFGVAAVKMAGDKAVDLGVLFDVSVEQIKRDAADLCTPRLSKNFADADVYADRQAFVAVAKLRIAGRYALENTDVAIELPAVVHKMLQ